MLVTITKEELQQIQLFQDLAMDELRYLSGKLKVRAYYKDEVIFKEGEVPGILYIVQQGKVEITKMAPTGDRQVIAMVPVGHFFGELSFLENSKHEARARATRDTRLFLLPRFDYDEMEKEKPFLIYKLLGKMILVISQNLDNMNENVSSDDELCLLRGQSR